MQNIEKDEKTLELIIQPRIIDSLGIKMYQKPADVISEFIANAWDADAEEVEITINSDSIEISDKGNGMTFDECQQYYLTVGRDRRKDTGKEFSEKKERPLLGRKGIGKFAGFGIATTIEVSTISSENGEKTVFILDIQSILEHDARNETKKNIKVKEYLPDNEQRKSTSGTNIKLTGTTNLDTTPSAIEEYKKELSRRFLLTQFYDDFKILINGEELPYSFSDNMEFVFPRDLTDEEKAKFPNVINFNDNGWAIESFGEYEVKWRIGFYEDTIQTEELRGIGIYAKGKLAQKPFFFDLVGGISAQNALEYMTGQVIMDFIDIGDNNLISTERQRINLQLPLGQDIKEWGIEKVKNLSSIWKKRRSEAKLKELNDKISGFGARLEKLPKSERKTVETVLRKIASFSRLGQKRFQEWCNDILIFWENGRLKGLIEELADTTDLDETRFIEMLSEAGVLTDLSIAETIKTKIEAISTLQKYVDAGEKENKVRDYIYENPWLIHPKWETYKKERTLDKLISDIAKQELNTDAFDGRVDLVLSSGSNLLLLEFMRPGLTLNKDHLDRVNYYVLGITAGIERSTASPIKRLESTYVVADEKYNSDSITKRVIQLADYDIYVLTWNELIENAKKQWEEQIDIIKQRNPNDERIKNL